MKAKIVHDHEVMRQGLMLEARLVQALSEQMSATRVQSLEKTPPELQMAEALVGELPRVSVDFFYPGSFRVRGYGLGAPAWAAFAKPIRSGRHRAALGWHWRYHVAQPLAARIVAGDFQ